MQQSNQLGNFLDVRGAAAFLGRSEKAVRRLHEKGRIRARKPDGKLMFEVKELRRFMGE